MKDRAFATPESQQTALRQLKILVLILVVSNIGLGLLAFYVLRGIDRKYTALIDQTVPPMNELQTLTAGSTEAMRTTNPIVFPKAGIPSPELVRHAQTMIERDRDLRGRALQRDWLVVQPRERADLLETGSAFTQGSLEVLHLLEKGQMAEAAQKRDALLRPAFDRYVTALTQTADLLETESLRSSDRLTAQTGSMSHMMLGIASWPVIIVGLFFLLVILFVAGVLLKVSIFRGAEV